jgi:hypothetical protein
MSDVQFDGTLDLTGADPDAVGFPAIPSGTYECHIAKAEWKATNNVDGTGKLPHGTPYLNLGIRVNEGEADVDGESVGGKYAGWAKLFVPPADYDKGKAQRMKNAMANLLNAIGEDWQKKGYKMPDAESLVGTQVVAVVRKKSDARNSTGFSNDIEGFKPAGTAGDAAGAAAGAGSGLR